jgi:pyroglutamyl-peptidase
MTPRPDILVTGFGPFPHVRVNPTERLARLVARRLAGLGLRAQALVLETSYGGGLPMLRQRLAAERPRAVLMLGLAARARWLRVEVFGRGRSSRLHPDATGAVPGAFGAAALPLRGAAAGPALAVLRRHGLRARPSPSAGRYLCDARYAAALGWAAASGTPVLFVHVPWLAPAPGTRPRAAMAAFRPRPAALAPALAQIGRLLARQGAALARHAA